MKTKLNAWIWLAILAAFSGSFSQLIYSGKINNYLHPKMNNYVIFATVVFIILMLNQVYTIFKHKARPENIKWGYLPFIVVLLILWNSEGQVNAQLLENKSVQNSKLIAPKAEIESISEPESSTETSKQVETSTDIASEDTSSQLAESETTSHTPADQMPETYFDDEFLNLIYKLQSYPHETEGQEITVKGFVYKSPDFKDNEMMVGRLIISCCAADATVLGVYIQDDRASQYPVDTWLEVTGTVEFIEKYDEEYQTSYLSAVLINPSIKKIKPLPSPYVYP